ncbi:MAG TPA: choline kinase family protein [Chitinophaga sp.]|uniref:choline kinase family protein n=1 Tax=Chitinophaga sp. TaxID=1869181 RepID=UPI002C4BA1AF|nr:choline kinase family protein [Chitinophaga sp.]HVI45580.1 choline kinase family protein [Chitinophaga sp.]
MSFLYPAHIATLQSLLLSHYNSHVTDVYKLSKGMTNHNYKCVLDNHEQVIVRLPGNGTSLLINRHDEYHNLCAIVPLFINVPLLYFNADTGIQVTRFVTELPETDHTGSIFLQAATAAMKKLHTAPVRFNNRFAAMSMIRQYYDITCQYDIALAPAFAAMLPVLERIAEEAEREAPGICPCHNDPVPENFILDRRYRCYLIDWEYAGMNSPLWDLAAFSLELNLSVSQEQYMLQCYYGPAAIPAYTCRVMQSYKILQDMLWYLWSMIKVHFHTDYFAYGVMRYNRGLSMLSSGDFLPPHIRLPETVVPV